jgi:hypothetical protein
MGTVVQKFDADGKSVERELEKMRREYDKLMGKMELVAKQSRRDAKAFEKQSGEVVSSLAAMAMGYVSLQQAAALFNAELQRRIDLEKRTADKNISVAASQAQVRKMIGNVSTDEFTGFLGQIQGIQTDSGFADIAQMNNAAAAILSATGSNQQATTEILAAVAPVFRDTPDQLATFAGAVADVMNVTKTDARSAAALALAGTANARIESLGGFANVAQAVGSGRSLLGDSSDQEAGEQIMALFGTMSRFSKDKEGGPTRTAVVTMLQKLEQFGGSGGMLDRLASVQEQLAAGTIKESDLLAGFEKTSFGTVRDLFRGTVGINEDLKATVASTKGSVESFNAMANDLANATPQLQAAAISQRIDMNTEQSQLGALGGDTALLAQARRARDEAFAGVRTTTLRGLFGTGEGAARVNESDLQKAETAREDAISLRRSLELTGFLATEEQKRADRALIDRQLQLIDQVIATLRANAQSRNAAAQSATHTER